jgi:hypothetical protein
MPRLSPVSSKTKTQKSKEEEDNFGIIIKRVFIHRILDNSFVLLKHDSFIIQLIVALACSDFANCL